MTTTGGPEHFLADPAPSNESFTDPVVLDDQHEPLEGDDIVVEPDPGETGSHPRKRTRELIVGVVVAVLVVAGVAIAFAARHDSGGSTHVTSASPARPPSASQAADKSAVAKLAPPTPKVRTKSTTPATTPVNIVQPTTPVVVPPPPPVSAQTPPSAGTNVVMPPTAPPVTTSPAEPPSVLEWTATPATLSIKAGAHALLTITVVNPTNGTVTLGHPLSCPPTLQPVHGRPLGGAVCAEMAQIMSPHSRIVQHYTIYATDTGAASGTPLAAGSYLANVENLHNVKVTVTAN